MNGKRKLIIVTCHPDDEVMWIGGFIHAAAGFDFIDVHVVCLRGDDPESARPAEFVAAGKVLGWKSGVIVDGPLLPAGQPMEDVGDIIERGLTRLGIEPGGDDLILTHSPYGDEHLNPHHIQCHFEAAAWARSRDLPFAYFSPVPMPFFRHTPVSRAMSRRGSLHLVNAADCSPANGCFSLEKDVELPCPAAFYQFQIDFAAKERALDCYGSVDPEQHRKVYAMGTCAVETLYAQDIRGRAFMEAMIAEMEIPDVKDFFFRFRAHEDAPVVAPEADPGGLVRRVLRGVKRRLIAS